MVEVNNIFIHSFGGLGENPYASTKHLTLSHIDNAHRARGFNRASLGLYVGYNFIIWPDGTWVQARRIGELTAAQTGYNHNSVSICIAGNFDINPSTGKSVDEFTKAQRDALKHLVITLVEGRWAEFELAPETKLVLSGARIWMHRRVADKSCPGNSIPDDYGKNIMVEYYTFRLKLLRELVEAYYQLLRLLPQSQKLGGAFDFDCGGHL